MAVYGGIDLGGTKIQTVLMRSGGQEPIGKARSLTPHEGGPPAVVDALVACLSEAADAAGVKVADLDGVGVGVPGEVDVRAGTLAKATNLSEWQRPYPLAAALSERLGPGVRLGNDVSVATQAELLLGAGRGAGSLLAVYWGTGVGGGVAFEGELWHGRGDAGEIGHMVVKQGGARCLCGRKGCMEAYAGRRAMEREAIRLHEGGHHTDLFKIMRERGRQTLSSGVWAKALAREDKLAERLVERAVQALGTGVASAVNLLDVETVLLGGGLGSRFGGPMLARVGEAMKPHLYNDAQPPVMKLAALGDLGGALGAALLWASAEDGHPD